MRMRKKPWAKNELEVNPRILKDPFEYSFKIKEYFGNDMPLHLELGCGRGRFITQTAAKYPEFNYIAIERDATALATAARLSGAVEASLAFMLIDANDMADIFMPGDISRMYLNFCDPWPRKKKWAKRRLTHVNYLSMYEALKIPEIYFKTDNRILFEFSINQFSERNWLMKNISLDLHKSEPEDNIMTEYEEKFFPFGPIYRLEACKVYAD